MKTITSSSLITISNRLVSLNLVGSSYQFYTIILFLTSGELFQGLCMFQTLLNPQSRSKDLNSYVGSSLTPLKTYCFLLDVLTCSTPWFSSYKRWTCASRFISQTLLNPQSCSKHLNSCIGSWFTPLNTLLFLSVMS